MFAHIVVFISFIYAIAITHPLASTHELIVARRRVRWSPLLLCWMAASVLLLVMNWLLIFRLSGIAEWSSAQILVHILAAVCLYFVCAFPAMRVEGGETIDMPAYFERNRVPILASFLVFGLVALLVNMVDLHAEGRAASGTLNRIYGILPNLIAEVVGLIVRTKWVQWAVVLFVLARLSYLLIMRITGG